MRAAAVVPQAPLLVPELAGGGDPAAAEVLAACLHALSALPDGPLALVGPGVATRRHELADWGTLAGLGVAVEAPAGHDGRPPRLPLSLTVGRWLLDRAGITALALVQEVRVDESPGKCRALGEALAAELDRGAVLVVVGDGSARRTERAPGYLDARAAGFDASVASALAAGNAGQLARLDPVLADELMASGRAGWQVLAAASGAQAVRATLHLDAAPFGVGYLGASWAFVRAE